MNSSANAAAQPGRLPSISPGQLPRIRDEIMRSNAVQVRDHRKVMSMQLGIPAALADEVGLAAQALAERAPFCQLYLVSDQMTPMAVDAARDVPGQILAEQRPCTTGLMAFSGGLPPTPLVVAPQVLVRPEIVTWTQGPAGEDGQAPAYLTGWCRVSQLPPELRAMHAEMTWMPVMGCTCELHRPVDWSELREHNTALVSLMLSTWILMDTPTVTDSRVSMETGPRGKGGKRALPREVRTVDLRRLARKPTPEPGEDADGPGRTFRHQWVVRGHWRNQAHGPERSQRRTTWVPSYLKGPEGAPFLASETVFVWRR